MRIMLREKKAFTRIILNLETTAKNTTRQHRESAPDHLRTDYSVPQILCCWSDGWPRYLRDALAARIGRAVSRVYSL